ncbi:MAG TPA: hypothetical protein VKK79_07510 [Candidatus Lokiarchaeia archaeon]|nr:hypothetical protein [Candidatus Lokiarchaeia archaeon]
MALTKMKLVSHDCTPDFEAKLNRFKDVDSESLISLFKDVEQTHQCILKALDTASGSATFFYSADASNCSKTMTEIKTVLFSRGIRDLTGYSEE